MIWTQSHVFREVICFMSEGVEMPMRLMWLDGWICMKETERKKNIRHEQVLFANR